VKLRAGTGDETSLAAASIRSANGDADAFDRTDCAWQLPARHRILGKIGKHPQGLYQIAYKERDRGTLVES